MSLLAGEFNLSLVLTFVRLILLKLQAKPGTSRPQLRLADDNDKKEEVESEEEFDEEVHIDIEAELGIELSKSDEDDEDEEEASEQEIEASHTSEPTNNTADGEQTRSKLHEDKAKAAPHEEEDLDAILAELGIEHQTKTSDDSSRAEVSAKAAKRKAKKSRQAKTGKDSASAEVSEDTTNMQNGSVPHEESSSTAIDPEKVKAAKAALAKKKSGSKKSAAAAAAAAAAAEAKSKKKASSRDKTKFNEMPRY